MPAWGEGAAASNRLTGPDTHRPFLVLPVVAISAAFVVMLLEFPLAVVAALLHSVCQWIVWRLGSRRVPAAFATLPIPLVPFAAIIAAVGNESVRVSETLRHRLWPAIALVAFSVPVINSIDNVLRPRLVGRDINTHNLLIFVLPVGSISLLGSTGIVLGTVLAALFITVWTLFAESLRAAPSQSMAASAAGTGLGVDSDGDA